MLFSCDSDVIRFWFNKAQNIQTRALTGSNNYYGCFICRYIYVANKGDGSSSSHSYITNDAYTGVRETNDGRILEEEIRRNRGN
jgi:hypothetical protein